MDESGGGEGSGLLGAKGGVCLSDLIAELNQAGTANDTAEARQLGCERLMSRPSAASPRLRSAYYIIYLGSMGDLGGGQGRDRTGDTRIFSAKRTPAFIGNFLHGIQIVKLLGLLFPPNFGILFTGGEIG